MVKCCAPLCGNSPYRKIPGITFHRFPKDENLKNAWVMQMNKKNWQPKTSSVLCSAHFEAHLVDRSGFRTVLTYNAIPTIFDSSLQEVMHNQHLCPECWSLVNEAFNSNTPLPPRVGHSRVCINCGKSLLRIRSHELRNNTEREAHIFNVIQQWNLPHSLVFNERGKPRSTGTTEEQPSTSAAAEQEYQPSRFNVVSGEQDENEDTLEIVIKEEISDEDRNQCRLCLSVGRRMQELGDYAPLYRKLLFENNYQNTTIPSFMFQMLACWECIAELRRVKRFQDKVRRANAAFESNQNHKSENMSNLSTIVIGHNESGAGDVTDIVSSLELCVQDIKEEAIEAEVEETTVPDPLEVGQGVQKTEEVEQIEKEPDITQTLAKRAKTEPKTSKNAAKRARTEQNEPKTTQEEENNPKSNAETDSVAIFAKVKIEIDELENILAERRNKDSFKAMKYKCDSCILGFTDRNRLMEHNKNFHNQDAGSCECDICERRFDDEGLMQAHFRNHFVKFVCKLCQFECYTKTGRTIHYKRHAAALQGASLESLLEQRLTSKQRAGTCRISFEPST